MCCSSSMTWISLSCWSPSKSAGCHRLDGCTSSPPRDWMSPSCSAGKGDRNFLTLNKPPEGEALALIRRRQAGGEFPGEVTRDIAVEIVRLLGGFTLAVEA